MGKKIIKFKAKLNGDNQVDPGPILTQARGKASLKYNTRTGIISWDISLKGLLSEIDPNIGVHIHLGKSGTNGPVLVNITKLCGSGKFPKKNVKDLLKGNTYINVHTFNHPNGVVRGQIIKVGESYDCDCYQPCEKYH